MKSGKRHHFGFSFQNMHNQEQFTLDKAEQQAKEWFGNNSLMTSLKFAQSQQKK